MPGITKEEVIAYLSALGPAGIQELLLELEDLWGIERIAVGHRHAPICMGPPVEMGIPVDFEVVLRDVCGQRIPVMKAVRELLGLSLADARALVDRAGEVVVAADLSRDEAERFAARLREAGAKVEVR
ncbi:MAG: ribosomal protein L7/L12 [Myxococcales bacterium]|nr:ribosomal protein L7/L12 [Myxococcales bacterium]MCB9703622.1 ribosomal protein L7/L12 [Myxococcales bacterium]